ncbi:MAG: hypothetical protein ACTS9Y_12895 [Methylophilus sp.]|uniref:hypothetical protein n=1 Tax=Methylophilus sp. TaxID=29541 RepID=UPI003F9F923C
MQQHFKYLIARVWFLINLFFSLYPPLYWEVGSSQKIVFGLPLSFIYFAAIAISITLSILYAYWEEASREGWHAC